MATRKIYDVYHTDFRDLSESSDTTPSDDNSSDNENETTG